MFFHLGRAELNDKAVDMLIWPQCDDLQRNKKKKNNALACWTNFVVNCLK